jgi:DNA mismatch endonuclease (patch repair protein)
MGKIQANRDRDYRAEGKLLADGWRVLTIWECALKGKQKRAEADVVAQIAEWILDSDPEVPHLNILHL